MTYFSKIVRWLFNKPNIKTERIPVPTQKFNGPILSDTRERKMYQGTPTRNYDTPNVTIRSYNELMSDNIKVSRRDSLDDSGYAVNQQDDNERNIEFYSDHASTSHLSDSGDPLLLFFPSSENQTSSLDCIIEKINDVWQRSRFVDYSLSVDDLATMQEGMTSAKDELLPSVVEDLTGKVEDRISNLKQARDKSRKRINPFAYTDKSSLGVGDIGKSLRLSPSKQKIVRKETIKHIEYNSGLECTSFPMCAQKNLNWEVLIGDNIVNIA